MGNKKSAPEPQPQPFLHSEWRPVNWNNKATIVKWLEAFHPENENIKHIRIMLHGPVGAGKSSFINSINNILRGRMTHDAHVATASGKSYTTTTQTHKIQKGNAQNFYPFVFTDLMGLEEKDGIQEDDIKLAMKGHIKDGYTFNPIKSISDEDRHYKPKPAPEDQTHVLVSVIPADKVRLLSQELIQKIQRIRRTASDLGVPQICIITKIDEISEEVEKDIRNVYKMKVVKEKMEEFSTRSGIPMTCVFPLKNYHEEVDVVDNVDVLLLTALQNIINYGEDFINKKYPSC